MWHACWLQVVMRNEEIAALKALRPKGLMLLGFKPVSCLRDYHTLSPSRFMYPDERALRGSTAAFVALHAACLADEGGSTRD
jgi:ATP-dependent DNA helicase 2 subunit 1